MSDLAELFAEETATPVKAVVPLLPDDGIPTTMECVKAVKLIHDAYMKNCAAAHRAEQEETIRRLHRRTLGHLRLSRDI